jgi:glycogen operon protein
MQLNLNSLRLISVKSPFVFQGGDYYPLGAQLDDNGCNFSVHADGARQVELCLYDQNEDEITRLVLPHKHGGYHYGYLKGIKAGQLYGYRVAGPNLPEDGHRFDARKLLIDPYAKALSRIQHWDNLLYEGDSGAMITKSVVVDSMFDWQGVTKPHVAREDTILYEIHVKGFTQLHPDISPIQRGRYLGLISDAALAHFKSLGVTSLQLLPVASFMSESRLKSLGLSNYWGYNPIAFMAPDLRYAYKDAVTEFKTMVRELHRNGLEVILDVVYNHSAEGGHDGPTLSLRGLANRHYYWFDRVGEQTDYRSYSNNSGCGNSINLSDPTTLRLVMDSLRYWAEEMQIDGFRFDLAASLAREDLGFRRNGAFFKAIYQDPILSQVKLIAEPWDIGPDGYQLGNFPDDWHECNDRFRDTMRGFWRGDAGLLGDFATRMMGSRDIFPAGWRSIHSSVNYICYHDGFTLDDLVSYEQRHNLANSEGNRDGHGHNLSMNCGEEGPSSKPDVLANRAKQKRNLLACLFFSQGIPHLLAGDEMGRTQLGNNNAYCQDNSISWLNWQLKERDEELLRFVQRLIDIRRQSGIFRRLQLEHDLFSTHSAQGRHGVRWFRPDGQPMHQEDWHQATNQAITVELRCAQGCDEHWLLLFNASPYSLNFSLPSVGVGCHWELLIDTQLEGLLGEPLPVKNSRATLASQSIQLLKYHEIN